jgi:ankyrin repeat protein
MSQEGDACRLSDQHFPDESVPLWVASGYGDVGDVHELLLAGGINIEHGHWGITPLMNAAQEGQDENVELLISWGADTQFVHPGTGDTALIAAATYGYIKVVSILLKQPEPGVDVQDKDGCTALVWAAVRGEAGIADLLLTHGAKVDLMDKNRSTALTGACSEGYPEIVNLLLKYKADASHVMDDGVTVFHAAVDNDSDPTKKLEILNILFDAGADINAKTDDNSTALHAAVQMGYRAVVQFLLQKNVCLDGKDSYGCTPLDTAVVCRETEIADMLRLEQLRRKQCEAFCMGQHERLGAESRVRGLDVGVARLVVQYI